MKWVTRKGVRLDRCACAWLIYSHIDPRAQILFEDEADLPAAIEQGALPFHNTVSEEPTTRERTTFQQLLAEYKLEDTDPALALMGDIVYGAETNESGSKQEGEGLRAIAKGMNALSSGDQDMIARMLPVFDALYAYCKRRVAGQTGWANAEPSWAGNPR